MVDAPEVPEVGPDPDATEEDLGLALDNIIPTRSFQEPLVVGIGGSAGSIPALQSFFAALSPQPEMAFVVVLHLSPHHESMLAELLQRVCSLPVSVAKDGERVLVNHVYVIPPGQHLKIMDGHLRLAELPHDASRRMAVDVFFRSLADSHGAHAVAVVLSGVDGDGAVGIKRLKERGGLTVVQDPEQAEQPGMPRAAIATGMVDWVLPVAEIPPRLEGYHAREKRLLLPPETGPHPVQASPRNPRDEEGALRDVLAFLRARTGRELGYYKRATIVRRLARRMQVNEIDELSGYLTFLRTHPGEAGAFLKDLLISVTNFFRDREAFEALERLIPELFKDKTSADTVRVWVPACATGEEAYSIAMLLSEHAHTLDAPPALQIFATDLDEDALMEARAGLYPDAIATDVSEERLRRFFVKDHQGYRVRRELREMLLFAMHDVLKDSPFSRLDLVSCRNLLIYLNRGAQQRIFDIFHFALRPEGRLFLGVSEAADDSKLFYPIDKKHRIYAADAQGSRASLPVPSGPSTLARALKLQGNAESGLGLARLRDPSQVLTPQTRATSQEAFSLSELHLKLIERFGPPSLVVNGEHEVLHLSQSAAPFLQFSGGEPSSNLLRLVHPSLRIELRAALFRARQEGQAARANNIAVPLKNGHQLIDVEVTPAQDLGADLSLVTFTLRPAPDADSLSSRESQEEPLMRHLERELEMTKLQLREIVEQHEASIEELQASNEELQAMNEELRSATEELETSREELQSINEELTTVNQELKNKVDELGHTNSDLHNLMGATAIATIFLDRELKIKRFTPPAVELFSIIPTDVGRPLADLQPRLSYPELHADASQVLEQLSPIEREVPESSGRFFLARVLPYRTTDDRIGGVVLTFVDVTERHRAREAMLAAKLQLEDRVQERTAQLDAANFALRQEVAKYQSAERARLELQRLLVSAQEQERGRMSRELHDEVAQQISALMLSLKALENAEPGGERVTRLRELRASAERVGKEIHQLAYQLRPLALDDLGLPKALSGLIEQWQLRTDTAVELAVTGMDDRRLPDSIETTIYRVIQEALNNVHKHAAAQNVSVSVSQLGHQVVAVVEDDGRGFDPNELNAPGSPKLGIAGMRERASIVGGELTLESHPGGGTLVRVTIPHSDDSKA